MSRGVRPAHHAVSPQSCPHVGRDVSVTVQPRQVAPRASQGDRFFVGNPQDGVTQVVHMVRVSIAVSTSPLRRQVTVRTRGSTYTTLWIEDVHRWLGVKVTMR